MFTLLIILLVAFRWRILEPLIGTVYMFLADAIMFTVLAAINFAQPGQWPWFGYLVACFCVFWAVVSGKSYFKYDALRKADGNTESKSDK